MNPNRRVVIPVIASTFFVGFGGGVVFPILPNLGTILGITPFMVGLILSANRFARLFANAPAGALVDRIGTRKPIIGGMIIETVGVSGYLIALESSAPAAWFFGSRVLWGLGSAAVFATAYTIAADVSDTRSLGTDLGVIRGGMTLGFPTGLVLGGVVSDVYGVSAAFAVAAGFAVIASVIAYLLIPETHVSSHRTAVKPWDVDTSVPALTVGLVNFAMFFAYIGVLFATLVLLVGSREIVVLGYGPQGSSGLLMAVTVVAATGLMLAGGMVSDAQQRRVPVLGVFLAVSIVGYLVLSRADSVVALVGACLLIGAGFGGTSGPLMAMLADLTPNERMGRAIGTTNVLGDLGGGLGPIVTLPVIGVVGFTPVYVACAAVPLVAVAVLIGGVYSETGSVNPEV